MEIASPMEVASPVERRRPQLKPFTSARRGERSRRGEPSGGCGGSGGVQVTFTPRPALFTLERRGRAEVRRAVLAATCSRRWC